MDLENSPLSSPSIFSIHDITRKELQRYVEESQTQDITVKTNAFVTHFLSTLKSLGTDISRLKVQTSTELDSQQFEYLNSVTMNIPPELRSHGVFLKDSDFFLMQSIFREEVEEKSLEKEARHTQQIWQKSQILTEQKVDSATFDQQTDVRSSLYQTIHLIKMASTEEIAKGKFDNEIEKSIELAKTGEDKLALKWLAYALFSGSRLKMFLLDDRDSTLLKSLVFLINDPTSDANAIADLLLLAYQARKETWSKLDWSKKPSQSLSDAVEGEEKENLWLDKANTSLKEPLEGQSTIHISHGGGLFYILQFLMGESRGYAAPTEFVGEGIFVSPRLRSGGDAVRDPFYANRRPTHFDIPAVLTADIPAEYLGAVPNAYEAVLRNGNLTHLKNISISVLPFQMDLIPPAPKELDSFIPQKEIREKVQTSINHYNRLNKAQRESDFEDKMAKQKIKQFIKDHWPEEIHEKVEQRVRQIQEDISLYGYHCEYSHGIPVYSLTVMNALEAMVNDLYKIS